MNEEVILGSYPQSIYQNAIEAKSIKDFFGFLYQYVEGVEKISSFKDHQKLLSSQRKSDCEMFEKFKKSRNKLIDKSLKELKTIEIQTPEIKFALKDIEMIQEGKWLISNDIDQKQNLFERLQEIAKWLPTLKSETDRLKLIQILQVKVDGKTATWEGDTIFENLGLESRKLNRIQEIAPWYAWEKLTLYFRVRRDFERQALTAQKNREYEISNPLFRLGEEIEQIESSSSDEDHTEFIQANYLRYLKVFHSWLAHQKIFQKKEENQSPGKQKTPYSIKSKEHHLIIRVGEKDIKFKPNTKKYHWMEELIKKGKIIHWDIESQGKLWQLIAKRKSTLYMDDLDATSKLIADHCYETSRECLRNFSEQGFPDFIITDTNESKINQEKFRKSPGKLL